MVHVVFEYKDDLSNGKWNRQECYVSSLAECKKIYGLGIDCEYRIVSVEGEEANTTHFVKRKHNPYERARNAAYATGNRWAIENWNATH